MAYRNNLTGTFIKQAVRVAKDPAIYTAEERDEARRWLLWYARTFGKSLLGKTRKALADDIERYEAGA